MKNTLTAYTRRQHSTTATRNAARLQVDLFATAGPPDEPPDNDDGKQPCPRCGVATHPATLDDYGMCATCEAADDV